MSGGEGAGCCPQQSGLQCRHDVIRDCQSGTDKIDLKGYFIAPADLTLAQTARSLLLSFPAAYETGEILLEGMSGSRGWYRLWLNLDGLH